MTIHLPVLGTVAVSMTVAWLIFSAFANTMPENPPASAKDIGGWLYRWLHDFVKTLVSSRGPAK